MKNNIASLKSDKKAIEKELDEIAMKHYGCNQFGIFPSQEKFKEYVDENKIKLEQLNNLQKEIEQLEWELMSPQEKEEYILLQEKKKEKYKSQQQ